MTSESKESNKRSKKETSENTEEKKGEKRSFQDDKKITKKRKKIKKNKKEKDDNSVTDKVEEEDKQSNEDNVDNDNENGEVKKKKPSIRQLKRERAELRAAVAKEGKKNEAAQRALNYISKWKYAKDQWKFEKIRQIWLIANLLDDEYVPDDKFPIILEYFDGCKGFARKKLIDKAMAAVKKVEDSIEENEEIVETAEYKRARQLLQALPAER